jgi:hypothetical protein
MSAKSEKVEVLVDLLRADASEITGGISDVFYYKNRSYWVLEADRQGIIMEGWRWIGQLGLTHVYRLEE